jgi:hypothetical protein
MIITIIVYYHDYWARGYNTNRNGKNKKHERTTLHELADR